MRRSFAGGIAVKTLWGNLVVIRVVYAVSRGV